MYDILYSFTFGEYYDFNAKSRYYNKTMKFLRGNYYMDSTFKL